MNRKLKLHAVTVEKTIYVVSENADDISSVELCEMADKDGASWESRSRLIERIGDVPHGDLLTNPHSDDKDFERHDMAIEDFFKELDKPQTFVDVKLRFEVEEGADDDAVSTVSHLVREHLRDMKDASSIVSANFVSAERKEEGRAGK